MTLYFIFYFFLFSILSSCTKEDVGARAGLSLCNNDIIAFGNVGAGESITQALTLTNNRNASITVTAPTLTSPFSWAGGTFPGTGGSCNSTLEPGGTCTVVIQFSPTGIQDYSVLVETCTLTGSGFGLHGVLDTTFNTIGMFTTTVGSSVNGVTGVAVQTDGKTLLSGGVNEAAVDKFALLRFKTNGRLDTTFHTDGIVTTPNVGGGTATGTDVINYTNNRIVQVGYSNIAGVDFMVAMYKSDGSLDTTFRTSGKAIYDIFGGNTDEANHVTVQSDNKIVVVGTSDSGSDSNLAIERLLSNGLLDTSFNTNGKVMYSMGGDTDLGGGVAQNSSGELYVSGFSNFVGGQDFFIARYKSNGKLDTAFHTDGVRTGTTESDTTMLAQVVIQTDGKPVSGTFYYDVSHKFVLHRFNTNGSLDTSFFTTGVSIYVPPTSITVTAAPLALQTNGGFLMGITYPVSPIFVAGLVRIKSDGQFDSAFGTTGIAMSSIGSDMLAQGNIAIYDGKIVQAVLHGRVGYDFYFGIARYNL